MAHACLQEIWPASPAATARHFYVTRVDPWSSGPFDDAVGRTFEVVDTGFARYQWRSRADVIREIAIAVAAGEFTIEDARRDTAFDDYVVAKIDEDGHVDGDAEDQFIAVLCSAIADGDVDVYQHGEIYYVAADGHLTDAGRALAPLPSWAALNFVDEGGSGSGYRQPLIMLHDRHTLSDLAEYFAALARQVH